MAASRPPRRGSTAWWRTTPTPGSWSRHSTRTCVEGRRSPRSPTPHELATGTRRWRTLHFVPGGEGCSLPLETDLEFSLGVREMPLRTVDSKLGSAREAGGRLGAAQPRWPRGLCRRRESGLAAGKAATWDWKRRRRTIGPKAFLKSVALGLCGLR